MCGAGVVRRYLPSNALIQHVGSLSIAKSLGGIQMNARLESKDGGIK